MVPSMKPEQLACVSALVGAGGNAGAVFAGFAFYKQDWDDTLTPFKLHAVYVIVTALMNPAYSWAHLGSMWSDAWDTSAKTDETPRRWDPSPAAKDTGSSGTPATTDTPVPSVRCKLCCQPSAVAENKSDSGTSSDPLLLWVTQDCLRQPETPANRLTVEGH